MDVRTHQAAQLIALARGLDGSWNQAFYSVGRMLRADASLIRYARVPISLGVGLASARSTIATLTLLLDGYQQSAADSSRENVEAAVVLELAEALGRIRPDTIDARRSAVSEYVRGAQVLADVRGGRLRKWFPEGETDSLITRAFIALASGPFLDEGQTLAMLGHRTSVALAAAEAPSGPDDVPAARVATEAFWWFHNPTGKLMIDSGVDMSTLVRRDAKHRAELLAAVDMVSKRLADVFPPTGSLAGHGMACPH